MRHRDNSVWRSEHRVTSPTSSKASGRHAAPSLHSSLRISASFPISRAKPNPCYQHHRQGPAHRDRDVSATSRARQGTPRGRNDPARTNSPRVHSLQPAAPVPRAAGRLWLCAGRGRAALGCGRTSPEAGSRGGEPDWRPHDGGAGRGPREGALPPQSQDATSSCTPGPVKGELGRSGPEVEREERTKPARNAALPAPTCTSGIESGRDWGGIDDSLQPIATHPHLLLAPIRWRWARVFEARKAPLLWRRGLGAAAASLSATVGEGRRVVSPACRPRSLSPVPVPSAPSPLVGSGKEEEVGKEGSGARCDPTARPRPRTAGHLLGSRPGAVSKWPIPSPRAACPVCPRRNACRLLTG